MDWEDIISLLILSPLLLVVGLMVAAVGWGMLDSLRGKKTWDQRVDDDLKKKKTWVYSKRFFQPRPGNLQNQSPLVDLYHGIVDFVPPGDVIPNAAGRYVIAHSPDGVAFTTTGEDVRNEDSEEVWTAAVWFKMLADIKRREVSGDLLERMENGSLPDIPRFIDELTSLGIHVLEFDGDVLQWYAAENEPDGESEDLTMHENIAILLENGDDPLADTPLQLLGPASGQANHYLYQRTDTDRFEVHVIWVDPYHYAEADRVITKPYEFAYVTVLKPHFDYWFSQYRL